MEDAVGPEEEVDVEAQAEVVGEFLEGLVASFGLEGSVATRVDDELIIADLTGEQTTIGFRYKLTGRFVFVVRRSRIFKVPWIGQ